MKTRKQEILVVKKKGLIGYLKVSEVERFDAVGCGGRIGFSEFEFRILLIGDTFGVLHKEEIVCSTQINKNQKWKFTCSMLFLCREHRLEY